MLPRHSTFFVRVIEAGCVLSAPLCLYILFFSGNYDYGFAIAAVPLLVLLNLGLAFAVSRRDPFLRSVMIAGTLLRVASSSISLFMAFRVYDTAADSLHYFTVGQDLANAFWARGQWPLMTPLWSTNLVNTLTGYLAIVAPSLPTLFVLFALLAFWGSYFFYRAFVLVFPDGDRKLAAMLLFFLPSIAFWTAAISKDAIIAFFLGLSAFGFARLYLRPGLRAYGPLLVGLLGCMSIRPHVAAMLASAMVIPYLMAKNRRGLIGGLSKAAGVLVLAAASGFLVSQAREFLQINDFQRAPAIIEKITSSSRLGGSAFGASSSLPVRLAMAPFLLFRPLPWEAHNLQSAVASLEGLALLLLVYRRRNTLFRSLRSCRGNFYVFFLALYTAEFCLTFSAAASNFGTLSRMRVMLLPFALMLLCLPQGQLRARIAVAEPILQPASETPEFVSEPR